MTTEIVVVHALASCARRRDDACDLGAPETDAHPLATASARLVRTRTGGTGAVREVVERVLAARTAAVTQPEGMRI